MQKARGRQTFRLFVSHCWDQEAHYYSLLIRLMEFHDFRFIDRSVPRHRQVPGQPSEIWEQIQSHISSCDVVVAFNSVKAGRSKWVQRELHAASMLKIPVIAVTFLRAEKTSRLVTKCADYHCSERVDQIVPAIRQAYAKHRKDLALDLKRFNLEKGAKL